MPGFGQPEPDESRGGNSLHPDHTVGDELGLDRAGTDQAPFDCETGDAQPNDDQQGHEQKGDEEGHARTDAPRNDESPARQETENGCSVGEELSAVLDARVVGEGLPEDGGQMLARHPQAPGDDDAECADGYGAKGDLRGCFEPGFRKGVGGYRHRQCRSCRVPVSSGAEGVRRGFEDGFGPGDEPLGGTLESSAVEFVKQLSG